MDVQQRIRQLELERGWTHYQLAKRAELSEATVNNLFRRNNMPTIPTLEALCKAFGITMAQFFTEGGEAVPLGEDQQILLARWSALSRRQQRLLLEFLGESERHELQPLGL